MTTYSVQSAKYGDRSGLSLNETLDHIGSDPYGPGRNHRMDHLMRLAPGESVAYRDGYDNLTTITRSAP